MILAALLALLVQATSVAGFEVTVVEPDTVEPYKAVVLKVSGDGFLPSCRVMIDKQSRFVPVKTEYVDENRLRAVLSAGLGPEPATRRIVVKCGGRRSNEISFRVEETLQVEAVSESEVEPPEPDEELALATERTAIVASLDPATVAAGEVITLTLMGSGFAEGARVEVLANTNAGTSRAPLYEVIEFEAEFASDSVLIVDFDRGFAASPRLRPVVVVNPDGSESLPVYLKITRRSP